MQSYLTIEHGGWLPIPYGRPDADESYPYIDLCQSPADLDRIPEARDFPALQNFLREVNGPSSAFRTMGCITIPRAVEGFQFPYEMRSYIDVGFDEWGWGEDAENIFVVYYQFTNFIRQIEKNRIGKTDHVQLNLNLKNASLRAAKLSFWSMEWWTFAYGQTQEEAIEAWGTAIDILREFLLLYSPQVNSQIQAAIAQRSASDGQSG